MSEWIDKVHALADNELAGDEHTEASEAVASNPNAAAEYQWAKLLKSELKDKLPVAQNDDLWKSCQARLDAIDKANRAESFVGKYAWAFCLVFLVGIFSAAYMNRTGNRRPLTNEHVAGLLNGLTPFSFSEPQDAIQSIQKRIGTAPAQLPQSTKMTSLAFGTVDGRQAAKVTYMDALGEIDMFVVSATDSIDGIDNQARGYRLGHINDWEALSWSESGNLFLLVSKRDPEQLKAVADQIRNVR